MDVFEEGNRIRISWERTDEEDVNKAREFFEKLTRQSWIAASKQQEYRRILEFKSEYGELWFIPISEGG
jgi:hypothetical protein